MPDQVIQVDPVAAREALTHREFEPFFQPLVELRTGELVGFEVLARWRHPTQGVVLPDQFISAAERGGWITELTNQLMKRAFSLGSAFPKPLTLAINVSAVQMRDRRLPQQVMAAARRAHFPLEQACFEITESVLIDNFDEVRIVALELKEMGCRLALDDFGTGYSSLLHLQSLPFDELKVDRSFVSSMATKRESRKIVAAVVGLGQSLGIATVAEGVETPEQEEMLRWLGCDLGQGWLYGKPVAAEEVAAIIATPRIRAACSMAKEALSIRIALAQFDSIPGQRLAQLRAVYDGAPVGLAFLDRELRYIAINERLANMNGASVSAHLGRTVREMIPELSARVEPFIQRALAGESISGIEIEKPANGPNPGKIVLLSYEPARDEAGEVVGVSVSLVDVANRHR